MHFIANVSKDLTKGFGYAVDGDKVIDMRDALGKYSMDTIASCAFGVHAESFTDEESKFVDNAKQIFRYFHVCTCTDFLV